MNVSLFHDTPKVLDSMRRIQKQIPFAVSQAINATALDVQKFEYEKQLPSKLTLRNQWAKPRSKFGVNVLRFARKDAHIAEVGSRAPWLASHEEGATLTPKSKVRLVPIIGGARATKTAKVNRRLKPRKGNAKVFFHPTFHGVFRLVGRGKNKRLQMLFSTIKKARVKPRLKFVESGEAHVRRVYNEHFDTALAAAMATAR